MRAIGEIIQSIILNTDNPVVRGGFTQVPNFILKDPQLSLGAKVAYAMFLSYAWHNDHCFPGQERLAEDMGMSRSRVTEFIAELERAGLVHIQRRGQGKTNVYTIHFQVQPAKEVRERGRTPRCRPADIWKSAGQPVEVRGPTSFY
jgi:hypothetical protein